MLAPALVSVEISNRNSAVFHRDLQYAKSHDETKDHILAVSTLLCSCGLIFVQAQGQLGLVSNHAPVVPTVAERRWLHSFDQNTSKCGSKIRLLRSKWQLLERAGNRDKSNPTCAHVFLLCNRDVAIRNSDLEADRAVAKPRPLHCISLCFLTTIVMDVIENVWFGSVPVVFSMDSRELATLKTPAPFFVGSAA